jgi:hypothetical protein
MRGPFIFHPGGIEWGKDLGRDIYDWYSSMHGDVGANIG